MSFNNGGRSSNGNLSFIIKRWRKDELEKAILELESRGFEVVGRGEREVVANSWSYSDSKLKYENAYAMQGTQGGRMYYARVRKKPVEMAVSTGG